MKRLGLIVLAMIAAGCGSSAPKEDMATKAQLDQMERDLRQAIQEASLALERNITDAKGKLQDVFAAEAKVNKALKSLEALRAQIEEDHKTMKAQVAGARSDMLKILEAEEKLLTDRLASLREVIEELRKK